MQVYKVETVGDCYMTVAGIPEPVAEHAEALCHTALGTYGTIVRLEHSHQTVGNSRSDHDEVF